MDPVRSPLHIHIIPQDSYDRELHCFHTDNEQARERESEGERVWGGGRGDVYEDTAPKTRLESSWVSAAARCA